MMVIVVASNEGPESPIVVVELERASSSREVLSRSLTSESEVYDRACFLRVS